MLYVLVLFIMTSCAMQRRIDFVLFRHKFIYMIHDSVNDVASALIIGFGFL